MKNETENIYEYEKLNSPYKFEELCNFVQQYMHEISDSYIYGGMSYSSLSQLVERYNNKFESKSIIIYEQHDDELVRYIAIDANDASFDELIRIYKNRLFL